MTAQLARRFAVFAACALAGVVRAVEPPVAVAQEAPRQPPAAQVIPTRLEHHSHVRIDNYYWLNQRDNPAVIAYLEAENAYGDAVMRHTEPLQQQLYDEIVGRIKQSDQSVPIRIDDYFYYTRFEEGKDYPINARRRGSIEAAEEVLLDQNAMAEGRGYWAVAGLEVSPDHNLLAFAMDTVGRRTYTIRFKDLRSDLRSGRLRDEAIPGASGNLIWANDSRTIFYTRRDPQTLRAFQVFRHVVGTAPARDSLVYEERDEEFSVFVTRTRSRRFLLIASSQTLSTEYRYLDADRPDGEWRVFLPRRRDHEYRIEHHGDHFYVRTNSGGAKNFRLMRTPVANTAESAWTEVIAHRDDVLLQGFELFRDHLVVSERQNGLVHLRIRRLSDDAEHYIAFDEPAYLAYTTGNVVFDTELLRYAYTSMTTPTSTYEYDMGTRERTLLKREEVLGGFDPAHYRTERLHAPARDGKRIPVSLVYRVGTPVDGRAPLVVHGYGSYGASRDPTFSVPRLSLLDRGFVYAIAHIRGGQELGREWYEDGKLRRKMNTFTDFIDATEFLIREGYGDPERVFAEGRSAGGLLMGAVINLRPDLYRGVIAGVPFVDVVTTMLDPNIPLTTFEYDEWGNPNDSTYYRYMLSYSPYDNVERKAYPHLLVTTGLHDSQVQYWEPAKWVAKLRALKTDDHRLLLKTNMEAGHGGASGRYRRFREIALDYAFLLDLAGLTP